MTTYTEPRADAWKRRAALAGTVDFTMMYVAHDAFNRDLERLVRASESGQALSPAAYRTWTAFCHQLHTHHGAENTALWPRLCPRSGTMRISGGRPSRSRTASKPNQGSPCERG